MTNSNDIGNSSTLVAIDIAQRRNEVLIQRPGRKRYRMSMTNDRIDHDRLVGHLQRIGGPVEIGFESQDHPPMIPQPPSGSLLVGSALSLQAHLSWDNSQS